MVAYRGFLCSLECFMSKKLFVRFKYFARTFVAVKLTLQGTPSIVSVTATIVRVNYFV